MTAYDIKAAMFRAFGITDKDPVDDMETVDVNEISARVRRLLTLFSFGIRGTL